MPIRSTSLEVADAINKLRAALKEEYGADCSYSINGRGMVIAQSNMNGVVHPVPTVHSKPSIPSNCPFCNGQREWLEVGKSANCFFCDKATKV